MAATSSDNPRYEAGYEKIFSSILYSTIWRESLHVKVVWITMLLLANRRGHVDASVPGLAHVAGVSIEQCEEALARLETPDSYSRTPDEEGRRIKREPGGWLIINHHHYHQQLLERDASERDRKKTWNQEHRLPAQTGANRRKPAHPAHYVDSDVDLNVEVVKDPGDPRELKTLRPRESILPAKQILPAEMSLERDEVSETAAGREESRSKKKSSKLGEVLELLKGMGVPYAPTARDGAACRHTSAGALQIASAYQAVYNGDWDPGGNGWLRSNLSIHLVIDRLAGYEASQHQVSDAKARHV